MTALHQDSNWPRASAWLAERAPPAKLSVIGVPLHLGSISPGRCDLAPATIRRALERYSPYDVVHDRDLSALGVADLGDLDVASLRPEQAFEPVKQAVQQALKTSEAVVLLGGDNSITRPGARALGDCGVITIDAHFDLRDLGAGLSNGNPIRALLEDGLPGRRIVQIGIQSYANSKAYADVARSAGITFFPAEHVMERGIPKVLREAFALLGDIPVYIDLDLDVLDRAYAPATPGSRPGGLHPASLRQAAKLCGANPRVRVLDLVEIDPEKDINDITSLTAAACLLEFASGVMER